MVKPQFELGRERVGRGVVRDPADRQEAILTVALAARETGLPVRGIASSRLPGPKGNRETFVWCGGEGPELRGPRGRDRRRRRGRDRRRGGRSVKTAALITHSHPPAATEAVPIAVGRGEAAGWRLVADQVELDKHGEDAAGIELERDDEMPDLCLVLGGDGTILHALRRFSGHGCAGLRCQLRHGRLPRGGRARGRRGGNRPRARRRDRDDRAARGPGRRGRAQRRSASTTSRSPAVPTTGSPS